MEGTLVNLIIQIIAGAIGGTAAGSALKDLSMGKAGDAISGAVGGGLVGQGFGRRRRGRRGGDGHYRRHPQRHGEIAEVRRSAIAVLQLVGAKPMRG